MPKICCMLHLDFYWRQFEDNHSAINLLAVARKFTELQWVQSFITHHDVIMQISKTKCVDVHPNWTSITIFIWVEVIPASLGNICVMWEYVCLRKSIDSRIWACYYCRLHCHPLPIPIVIVNYEDRWPWETSVFETLPVSFFLWSRCNCFWQLFLSAMALAMRGLRSRLQSVRVRGGCEEEEHMRKEHLGTELQPQGRSECSWRIC